MNYSKCLSVGMLIFTLIPRMDKTNRRKPECVHHLPGLKLIILSDLKDVGAENPVPFKTSEPVNNFFNYCLGYKQLNLQ